MKLMNVALIALASVALTAGCTKKEEAAPAAAPAETAAPVEAAAPAEAAPADAAAPAGEVAPTPTPAQ